MTPKGLQSLYDTKGVTKSKIIHKGVTKSKILHKGVTKSVRHQRGYKVCMTPKGLQSL